MEPVSMNDGLDGRETIAFGLGAAEVGVFVGALLSAYAAVHGGLPGAVGWSCGGVLALTGAALAWGRVSGRSLLEWAVLLVRFLVRTRAGAALAGQSGMVVPVPLRRHAAARPPQAGAVRVAPTIGEGELRIETFFSLGGGTGRTTLAVEVAALLAVRAAASRASGGPRERVALLDMATRAPTVALRLGIPVPTTNDQRARHAAELVVHRDSGLLVFPGPVPQLPPGEASAAWAAELLGTLERAGATLAILDIDNDLGAVDVELLRRCCRVHVTLAASAGGVLDAYRSTARLHRLGIRDQVDYVVNRCRGLFDLSEAMGDLGGAVVAEIPHDLGLVDAENRHMVASLDERARCAAAMGRLADVVGRVPAAAARGSRAG
jgi:Flp pilus assembly CpaE family ATPase